MSKKAGNSGPEQTYNVDDIVLAKVKGYPSWPGQIVDTALAPPAVAAQRPPKTKTVYLVQFFPTGDYAWTATRDISLLSAREIDTYVSSPAKKSGDLLRAYKTAANPSPWRAQIDESQRAFEELQAQMDQDDTVDQLASGDEVAGGGKATAAKKRKRKSEGGATAKEEKEDKKAKKAKLEKLAKGRIPGGSKAVAEYEEDDSAAVAKKSKSTAIDDNDDPGLKQVKDWRHKLQKVFLGKTAPTAEDMPKCKEYFDAMEVFEMQKDWLTESKLAKVLKRICLMAPGTIPNGDVYDFKNRSSALAMKWSQTVGTPSAPGTETPKLEASTPVVAAVGPTPGEPSPAFVAPPAPVVAPEPTTTESTPQTNGAAAAAAPAPVVEEPKPVAPAAAVEEPAPFAVAPPPVATPAPDASTPVVEA